MTAALKSNKHFSRFLLTASLVLTLGALVSCQKAETSAKVIKLNGTGEVIRKGKSSPLTLGTELLPGDLVKTSRASTAILQFKMDSTLAELQADSDFVVGTYSKNKKELKIHKGKVWLKVAKLGSGESFVLTSPAAIAGVRGTTFYTAQAGDMWVTCHCEGDVHYEGNGAAYHSLHHKDQLAFSRGGKTVVVNPGEVKNLKRNYEHHHSALGDSPLGAPADMDPVDYAKIIAVAEKKFAELK